MIKPAYNTGTMNNAVRYIVLGVMLLIFLIFFFPIVIIGAGERGVVFNNFSGVEDRILGEGTHFRVPFLQSVISMDIKTQKTDVKAEAASKDLQTVNSDIVVNWHLDASRVNKVYQEIGDEEAVRDRIIIPAVNETVKAATAKLTASEVLARRTELKTDLDGLLAERLGGYGVLLDDVSIVNVNFSTEFNRAIEAKQVAQQEAERALFRVQEASATAQANRLIEQSLTDQLLQVKAIEKWDGKLPAAVGGATPFINIPTP